MQIVTDENSFTFKYEVSGEVQDLYLGEKKYGTQGTGQVNF